jgi:hypothetical protein
MSRDAPRYLHPIDDAWRARMIAAKDAKKLSLSEIARRLEREGVTCSRSALHLTLYTAQAGSKFKADIERVLGVEDSDDAVKDAPSSENSAPAAVRQPDLRTADAFNALITEIAELRDDQVPAVLALVRSLRSRR